MQLIALQPSTHLLSRLSHNMNVINWQMNDIKKLDTKTRKLLTMYRIHHPEADEDRLYLQRSEGGRGLIQIELT